ncbi:MAG: helix-turn-helix domain-containing protein [Alphaproteobacteria bacterium]
MRSAYGSHVLAPLPDRATTLTDAHIVAMRAGGMSTRAIRRALGLSEAAATAAGILESGRLVAAPDGEAPGPCGPGGARGSSGRRPQMDEVLDAVSRVSGIDRGTLIAPGQRRSVVRARQLAICLIREFCPKVSLLAIGLLLDRDPTTVFYGCRRAGVLLRRDRAFREAYQRTRRALKSRTFGMTPRVPEAGLRG